jgi:hypothetical protein
MQPIRSAMRARGAASPSRDEVTHPDDPTRLIAPHERVAARLAAQAAADAVSAAAAAPVRPVRAGLAFFGAAIVLCMIAYVAATVPGPWFPRASAIAWEPGALLVARGNWVVRGGAILVTATDATQTAVISLNTDIPATDYRSVIWDVADVPADADVRMLWRSDLAPTTMNSMPVPIVAGRLQPVDVTAQPDWLGPIRGIAIAIRAPLTQPITIRRVVARPMGALDVLRDRFREWLAFEPWSGTSINEVAGGARIQDIPLPMFLVIAALPAMLATWLLLRRSPRLWAFPLAIGAIFAAAWFIADLRWQWNLARQVAETQSRYAGKDWRERHLAAEDASLFAFIEAVRAKLPAAPARVFIVADAHYFRDRGAYHLYPHNVYFDPYRDTLPPPSALRPGDYLVVYQRRGLQYDAALQRMRFPDGTTRQADVILAGPGAVLLKIR